MMPLLPIMVFLPLIFIIPLFAVSEDRSFTIAIASATFLFIMAVVSAYVGLSQGFGTLSFSSTYIPYLGINFELALNGYTNILVLMSSVVILAAAMVSRNFIKESARTYNILFLLIQSAAFGFFLSGNLFLLYVFWEISEFSMFFMIYIFGGYDRRYAAIKFLIYSLTASLFLLIGIMVLFTYGPVHSFSIQTLVSQDASLPAWAQITAMLLLLTAFLIKMPVFPFHAWLPDAHTEAPTTGSMILAGILLKFGGYGLLLLFLLLPFASGYAKYMAVLFGISAIYAAFIAIRQTHLKRLIAYTSIVDMGIVALGLASSSVLGNTGAVYAMLSHGLVISLLFLIAGVIDESFGTMLIEKVKGVVKSLPGLAYSFVFSVFAFAGIPLTAGFIGDILIFTGAYGRFGLLGLAPLGAVFVVSAFMFLLVEKVFLNSSAAVEPIFNPKRSDYYAIAFLMLAAVVFGVLPFLLLAPFSA